MKVQKFSISDAELVKSPGQDADIYVGNLVDKKTVAQSRSVMAGMLWVSH